MLFNNDRTYDLSNHAYFEKIFQEAIDTTIFGYEEFDGGFHWKENDKIHVAAKTHAILGLVSTKITTPFRDFENIKIDYKSDMATMASAGIDINGATKIISFKLVST